MLMCLYISDDSGGVNQAVYTAQTLTLIIDKKKKKFFLYKSSQP